MQPIVYAEEKFTKVVPKEPKIASELSVEVSKASQAIHLGIDLAIYINISSRLSSY